MDNRLTQSAGALTLGAMKASRSLSLPKAAAALVIMASFPASALDLDKANPFNWFKEKEKSAPDNAAKQAQENDAAAMMRDARTAASTGDVKKAREIYKTIVRKYPFTDAAADAQFEYATLSRQHERLQDAYDAFQKVISDYRSSPRFADAVQQQFEIAEEARSGKKEGTILLIPMKMGSMDVIKLYQGIIKNAPYGKYSAPAQFAIGEIYQERGDKAEADSAYQMVVDNYPATKQASEAQFRLGAINSAAAKRSQDSTNLVKARDALQTYSATNPTGEHVTEVETQKRQNSNISAERSLDIARYYERNGKPKAAAIYYNDALRFGASNASVQAREHLAALSSAHPDDVKETAALADNSYTIPAAANLKNNDNYAGPPGPELAKLGQKPKMRVEKDDFMPIPLKEPELPVRNSTSPAAPGMLIPPVTSGDKQTLLPVPPAPGMALPSSPAAAPAAPPVPPAPDDKKTDGPSLPPPSNANKN
jgi:outer membrane protein assembly factor BamD (BamD/ComL family)